MWHWKQENIFRWLDINFLKIVKTWNFVSLPDHIRMTLDAKQSIIQLQFYSTTTTLLVRCAFWVLMNVEPLHAAKPYPCVNYSNQHFPWAVYLEATISILKWLCYSRDIGQVRIRCFECKIWAKIMLKWAWEDRYIFGLVDGSHFSFSLEPHVNRWNNRALFGKVSNQGLANLCEADSPLLQQSP